MRGTDGALHPGRRLLLSAAGGIPIAALIGACGPDGGIGAGTGAPSENGESAPGRCHVGAIADRTSDEPSDGAGEADAGTDPSVLAPTGLAVSPDGAFVAANKGVGRTGPASSAGTTLWNTSDGTIAERFGNELAGAIAWHPDGSLLAIGGAQHIEAATPLGEVSWSLTGHGQPLDDYGRRNVHDLVFSDDGATLASLGADGAVRLWSGLGDACTPGAELDTRALRPLSIALSPDGSTLAVAGTEGEPELWDINSGQRATIIEGTQFAPRAVAYLPDGTLLIGTGVKSSYKMSDPERARLFFVPPGEKVQEGPTPPGRQAGIIAVSADGMRIAVGDPASSQVMIWDRENEQDCVIPAAPGAVGRLAWSPHGQTLLGASPSQGVLAWDGEAWSTFNLP